MVIFYIQLIIPILLFFRKVKITKLNKVLFYIFILLFCGGIYLYEYFIPKDIPLYIFWYYFIPYIAVITGVLAFYKESVFKKMFLCILSLIIQTSAHHICQLYLELLSVVGNIELPDEFGWVTFLLYSIVYTIVYASTYIYIVKRTTIYDTNFKKNRFVLFLFVGYFLSMIIYGIYIKWIVFEEIVNNVFSLVYEIYSVGMSVFFIFMLGVVFGNEVLRNNAAELERRLEQEARYYEMMEFNINQINMKCHDLKHQIKALKTMPNEEDKNKYINELSESVMFYESLAKTGNDALDCILTEKSLYCRNQNITFTFMADGNVLKSIDRLDIYSLFGNAIENAIDCVSKYTDESKRVISLKIFNKGGWTNIVISNYFDGKLNQKKDLLLSTKGDDVNHGFGMKSMNYIVGKYNGSMFYRAENKVFQLNILIPINR